MAQLLGLIDVKGAPDVTVSNGTGSVLVRIDGDTGLRFASRAAFAGWLEALNAQPLGEPLPGLETVQ